MNMDVWEARDRLLELGDKAHKGEEVVITKDGQPWLRLTPCPEYQSPPLKPRKPGLLKGKFEMPSGWDDPMAWVYERDLCEECLARYKAQFLPAEPGSP